MKKNKIPDFSSKKKNESKSRLHPRNKHIGRYDLKVLADLLPALKPFVFVNDYGNETIDFFNSEAVKTLNTALLKQHYGIDNWDIPKGYLCPPVPGRADYIHHVADLLMANNFGELPASKNVNVLDIGTGANGIYALISAKEYGWNCVATDIDEVAVKSVSNIVEANPELQDLLTVRTQENEKNTFSGVLKLGEKYDLTICNPPFHGSLEESKKGTLRKLRNLKKENVKKAEKNFEGVSNELWCEGGELRFIQDMIAQSRMYSTQVLWFTTLVSKQSHLRAIHKLLRVASPKKIQVIEMGQGQKSSRIVAWTFMDKSQMQEWRGEKWLDEPVEM